MQRSSGGSAGVRPAGVAAWVLFDWAAQPFFTLVTTFVFAPFFAARVAADPVTGQAAWGYTAGAAGLVIALLSPALGSIADAGGNRKPWIAGFSILLVIGSAMLWLAVPGAEAAVPVALAGFAIATIGAEFATVFNNAMMPDLVPPERLGRLSGTGWAVGYLGGLVSLVLTLGFLAANPETGHTLLGLAPLFGLDPATGAGDRASGPLTALWYVVFVAPLFLLTPDVPRRLRLRPAVRAGLRELGDTLAGIGGHRNALRFLVSHMIYADGLAALFIFGGIYAAGSFGWSAVELGLFGIVLTVAGTAGAFAGGRLDDRLGPKRVILASLVLLILASAGILSITPDSIAGIAVVPPVPGDGLFASPAERGYLGLGVLIGLVAGPLQAASRTMLVKVAPRGRITQFFGLFALSGKVTSFVGPVAVGAVTSLAGSQRVGISVLVLFFAAGVFGMAGVGERREAG